MTSAKLGALIRDRRPFVPTPLLAEFKAGRHQSLGDADHAEAAQERAGRTATLQDFATFARAAGEPIRNGENCPASLFRSREPQRDRPGGISHESTILVRSLAEDSFMMRAR